MGSIPPSFDSGPLLHSKIPQHFTPYGRRDPSLCRFEADEAAAWFSRK